MRIFVFAFMGNLKMQKNICKIYIIYKNVKNIQSKIFIVNTNFFQVSFFHLFIKNWKYDNIINKKYENIIKLNLN